MRLLALILFFGASGCGGGKGLTTEHYDQTTVLLPAFATKQCPELCPPWSGGKVETCEIVTVPRPEPEKPPIVGPDPGCPAATPAALSACTGEGLRCAWPREGTSWCTQVSGTCKSGQWQLGLCGASFTPPPVSDPTVCPSSIVPIDKLPQCPYGAEQRCAWKTGDTNCPDVEAFCYGGTWRDVLCVRESKAVAVHCAGTYTPWEE